MDIIYRLPLDIGNFIMRYYYSIFVLPILKTEFYKTKWLWKCSLERRIISTERGAIQLGYCDNYDGWSKVYLKLSEIHCINCEYKKNACESCIMLYRLKTHSL